ncbi:MAG: 3-deoxy-7-phosphoheptulonate synthase [Treponema sp.]|nr:3-deoxy-7-phosphoheptulonate synthase [Treponema sp.]
MIIAIKQGSPTEEVRLFAKSLEEKGVQVHFSEGVSQTVLGLVGDTAGIDAESLSANHLVEKVVRVQEPYKRANRKFHPDDSYVRVSTPIGGELRIGDGFFSVIAGPCSVENREQILGIAESVKESGAGFLRGGAFKPRTSPYSFQGLGVNGLELLLEAKKQTGLPIVTEIMDLNQLDLFGDIDIIQVGARNMQNFTLLKELGRCGKPILLKRGLSATINELLMSAEYVMAGGNENIILCERGIRTFETYTRNTLDISAIPALRRQSHLPVIVDPSHAAGLSWMVETLSKAAVAAGADGLIMEVHNNPEKALSDGEQSLNPSAFTNLMQTLKKYIELEGKKLRIEE